MSDLVTRLSPSGTSDPAVSIVRRSLESVRAHLGMDVAYVSEFVDERSVYREVDAPGLSHLIAVGGSRALDEVYCRHIVAGRLPELMPDTAAVPLAAAMPITRDVPIGAHVSVPIRKPDGELFGMFCCLSAAPRPTLNERDLHIVRAFADLVAEQIGRDLDADRVRNRAHALTMSALEPGAFTIHLQPICDLLSGEALGWEALSRFAALPVRSPDRWFADATAAGFGVELESAAIAAAARLAPMVPAGKTLSVNASPATVTSGVLDALIGAEHPDRLVLELTEHADVEDYDLLELHLGRLRARGARVAIDDAGAGFSGLQHILRLRPDIIKLDMALIRGIDADPARRALAAAMQAFARQTGATLTAEGIETAAERKTLVALGFRLGQGYLLGRPAPWQDVLDAGSTSGIMVA